MELLEKLGVISAIFNSNQNTIFFFFTDVFVVKADEVFPRIGAAKMKFQKLVYLAGGNDIDRSGYMDETIENLEILKEFVTEPLILKDIDNYIHHIKQVQTLDDQYKFAKNALKMMITAQIKIKGVKNDLYLHFPILWFAMGNLDLFLLRTDPFNVFQQASLPTQ